MLPILKDCHAGVAKAGQYCSFLNITRERKKLNCAATILSRAQLRPIDDVRGMSAIPRIATELATCQSVEKGQHQTNTLPRLRGGWSGQEQRGRQRWRPQRFRAYQIYCGNPSMAKARNLAYLSPISRAFLYSAELRQACAFSRLSQTWIATRGAGGAPSRAVTFCPAASSLPPEVLMLACASGAYSLT